jgi:hypothetical protein
LLGFVIPIPSTSTSLRSVITNTLHQQQAIITTQCTPHCFSPRR